MESLMANNIQVLEDFYKKEKLETLDEEGENTKTKKNDNESIIVDWMSLNVKENEKFLKIEERAERIKNGEEDSDDDYEDNDSDSSDGGYNSSDSEEEVENNKNKKMKKNLDEDEEADLEDEEEEEEKNHKHRHETEEEKEERESKYDELSKFYCYRIMIEFVRELKNLEEKITFKNEDAEDFVYRKYDYDESTDEESFSYKMSNNLIALKTKHDNESYVSFLMLCFELVFDDSVSKFNDIRRRIIDANIEVDIPIVARIKKMKNLNVEKWFTIIEDSLAIPFGDFVKFEFNYDKSKIIEKTRYEFDDNITEENVENIRFYTVLDIMNMYEQKIFENRIVAKYH